MTTFDSHTLPADDGAMIAQHTAEIRRRVKRTAEDIIEIGRHLTAVKALLPHGAFGVWLKAEFDWSERTARNLMRVFDAFKTATVADLQIQHRALYLLASPSTPEAVRVAALERAKAGEPITDETARTLIESHREERTSHNTIQEAFTLDEHFDKLDPEPEHECPKCGYSW